ncbi:MAG: hypothetical protein JW751_26925 [Polyangiaceae bacterium]|nr:hypothetical protein [Polyangiaceae bacterium]
MNPEPSRSRGRPGWGFGAKTLLATTLFGASAAAALVLVRAFGPPQPAGSAPVATKPSAVPTPSVSASASAAPAVPLDPDWTAEDDALDANLEDQRAALFRKLRKFRGLSAEQVAAMRAIVEPERWFGQGNPKPTAHPMTRAECRAIRARAVPRVLEDRVRCGARHMVPIYDSTRGETGRDAKVCIDQYEFPNIPCEYPTTWVRAQVAQQLCAVEGKRLCDAHEWEGACAGAVLPAEIEYAWGLRLGEEMEPRRIALQYDHNQRRQIRWAYGQEKDHTKCATGSRKNRGCVTPSWEECGTNTYPAGAFPDCVSPFGAYDLHGNAAEHMNLPMAEREQARYGSPLGQTEMKGSWFIFATYEAHLDDCRWRAPDWHGGRVLSPSSHMNYHLGFRCCKDLVPVLPPNADAGVPGAAASAARVDGGLRAPPPSTAPARAPAAIPVAPEPPAAIPAEPAAATSVAPELPAVGGPAAAAGPASEASIVSEVAPTE